MTQVNTGKGGHKQDRSAAAGDGLDDIEEVDGEGGGINEYVAQGGDNEEVELPFNKHELLDHLTTLEEDNLFKIHLVQEDEQALEAQKKAIEENIIMKEKEIMDVKRNIEMLEHSKAGLVSKQQFLESNMKLK